MGEWGATTPASHDQSAGATSAKDSNWGAAKPRTQHTPGWPPPVAPHFIAPPRSLLHEYYTGVHTSNPGVPVTRTWKHSQLPHLSSRQRHAPTLKLEMSTSRDVHWSHTPLPFTLVQLYDFST